MIDSFRSLVFGLLIAIFVDAVVFTLAVDAAVARFTGPRIVEGRKGNVFENARVVLTGESDPSSYTITNFDLVAVARISLALLVALFVVLIIAGIIKSRSMPRKPPLYPPGRAA